MEWIFWITALVVAIITLCLAIYKYFTHINGYWETQGLKTIKPIFPYGSTYEYLQMKPSFEIDDKYYKLYGRMFGTYEFGMYRSLNIADPEHIRQILVKDFHVFTNRRVMVTRNPMMDLGLTVLRDEHWKRVRAIVSPTFTSGKMRKMNPLFLECTKNLVQNFSQAADAEADVDLKRYFSCFTMDVIGCTAFGIRLDSLKSPDHPFVVNGGKLFQRDISFGGFLLFLLGIIIKPLGRYFYRALGLEYIEEVSREMIHKRKSSEQNGKTKDFLQLMLDAREGKLEKEDQDNEDQHPSHYFQEDTDGKAQNIIMQL